MIIDLPPSPTWQCLGCWLAIQTRALHPGSRRRRSHSWKFQVFLSSLADEQIGRWSSEGWYQWVGGALTNWRFSLSCSCDRDASNLWQSKAVQNRTWGYRENLLQSIRFIPAIFLCCCKISFTPIYNMALTTSKASCTQGCPAGCSSGHFSAPERDRCDVRNSWFSLFMYLVLTIFFVWVSSILFISFHMTRVYGYSDPNSCLGPDDIPMQNVMTLHTVK